MFIKKITISNIRAVEELELEFLSGEKKLIILIGHNNSGKTSVLEAVKFFFSAEKTANYLWPLSRDGSYKELTQEQEPSIVLEIAYTDEEIDILRGILEPAKKDERLNDFLHEGTLVVKKRIIKVDGKIQADKYLFKDQQGQFEDFVGRMSYATKLLPRFVYLPSITSIEDCESSSKRAQHTFEELFELYFEGFDWGGRPDVVSLVDQLVDKVNRVLQIESINQSFEAYLRDSINLGIEGVDIQTTFTGVEDLSNLLKRVKIFVDDGVVSDATLKGAGTQRLIIFALLRLISEQRRVARSRETIFLIDEPDLHLHPQLQKEMRNIMEDLARNFHLIVATHSHLMLGKQIPKGFVIKKLHKESGVVKDIDLTDEESVFRELFTYLGYVPSDFMLPDNIILVEGRWDKIFLDRLVELMIQSGEVAEDLKDYDVSVINIGGDGQFKKAIRFLKDLPSVLSFFQGLPTYAGRFCALFDGSKAKSAISLQEDAEDKAEPHRIIALPKNGIEYYYPESLLRERGEVADDIVRDPEKKRRVAEFIAENMGTEHLCEVDEQIRNLMRLAFQNCRTL